MSAFDDEFGLFGDDEAAPEDERRPTLGARKIASSEGMGDDIEPEEERPPRRRGAGERPRSGGRYDADRGPRTTSDPAAAQARAVALLDYLARKLVSKPDDVLVELVEGARGATIELEVHPEDFGKVIGKGGRVAQALRTLVRAAAEGKVTVDIVDVEDDDLHEADLEHAGDTSEPVAADETPASAPQDGAPENGSPAAKRKRSPSAAGAKKKRAPSTAKRTRKK